MTFESARLNYTHVNSMFKHSHELVSWLSSYALNIPYKMGRQNPGYFEKKKIKLFNTIFNKMKDIDTGLTVHALTLDFRFRIHTKAWETQGNKVRLSLDP